jgi:UDP-N-acetylmuramate dehydrogenase
MHLLENVSLKPYNTFGIDASAKSFCRVRTKEQMEELIRAHFNQYKKVLILGEGSNVLFCSDYDGLVIKNEITGIEILKEDENHIWLQSLSGTNWHELVMYCVARNYGGIENLSLIPGTTGAAPMQNIGAYGVELKDVFVSLEAIDLKIGETFIFNKDACEFGYRQSIFKTSEKGKYFIYSITLKLAKHPELNTSYGDIKKMLEKNKIQHPTIKDISDAVIEIRRSKLPHPKMIGNAGSFFKNPEVKKNISDRIRTEFPSMPSYTLEDGNVKIPAAWLIEQCGWKGKQIGNTGSHSQQALVIVNYGHANGEEIWEHALRVQESVKQKFGILLDPEVNIIK